MAPAEAKRWIDHAAFAIRGWRMYNPHDWDVNAIISQLRKGRPDRAAQRARDVGQIWRRVPPRWEPELARSKRRTMLFVRGLIREYFNEQ